MQEFKKKKPSYLSSHGAIEDNMLHEAAQGGVTAQKCQTWDIFKK